MNKLKNLIDTMSEEDLQNLQKDILSGNLDIAIESKLKKINISKKVCPVCGEKIGEEGFVLEFGKEYLRRKAWFDARDCLLYFVEQRIPKKEVNSKFI